MRNLHVHSPIKNQVGGVFIPVRDIEKARDWYCKILGVSSDIVSGEGMELNSAITNAVTYLYKSGRDDLA